MIAAASSDGSSWVSLTISSAERSARSRAPASGPSSLRPSIASFGVALGEQREGGVAILVVQFG